MKRALAERSVVVIMFALVLIVFSIAEKDTKKLIEMYSPKTETVKKAQGVPTIASHLTDSGNTSARQ